jgi:glucose/mannose-6-phosphate isomerase
MEPAAETIDPNNMAREIYDFLENLETAVTAELSMEAKFDRIMICGMGGSAIGGDIIADCVYDTMDIPITVQRFPVIPRWVNTSTLVIVSSYSGNTKETILMYEAAIKRGCKVIVITSGGQILEKAKANNNDLIVLPSGIQPRSALGYILGYMANVIETVGGPACKTEMSKILPKLIKFRAKLISEKGVARTVAKRLYGKAPIIYSTVGISSSAMRWKTQINENSKMIAFSGMLPEFNHNEIAGWINRGDTRDECVIVILYEENADKIIRKMTDAAISTLKSHGMEPEVIKIRGKKVMERCLRATMFGDYVSLYLAYMQGVDPSEVETIKKLKIRLEQPLKKRNIGRSGKKRKG